MQFGGTSSTGDRLRGLTSWLGASERSRGWHGFLNAGIAVGVTVLLRVALEVLFAERAPTYMVFLAPVLAASLLGGVLPGIFAAFAAWGISYYFFIDPTFSFKSTSEDWVIAGVFLAEGSAIALVGGRLRAAVAELLERGRQLAASEARLLAAQQAARIATYEWDPSTGKTVWSENAEAIMGMTPGSFDGTFEGSFKTVAADDKPRVDAAANQLMRDGANELEYRITDHEGRAHWIRATGTLIRGETPAQDRVVGVMMDVTERKRDSENNQFLANATAELARSLDYRSNVVGVAKAAIAAFADMSAVVLLHDGQFPGEVVAREHRDPARADLMRELEQALLEDPERPGLIGRSIRSGRAMFLPGFGEREMQEAVISERHGRALAQLNLSSAICVPLIARDRTLGALVFAQEAGRSFDPADFRIAAELGRRAALAIENSLLLEQSFEREAVVSRANEALQLIADAGVELSATLNLPEALGSLARLVVLRFADVCAITLVEGARLETAAMAAANDELRAALEAIPAEPPWDGELLRSASHVLQSDRPVFVQEFTEEMQRGTRLTTARMAAVRPRSLIMMPLSARGQSLGVMTFMRVQGSPLFDREDLSLAGQIARRTAVATDNARLYNEARRANDAKDEFLGMMSHELRTPITVIHGGARVLRSRGTELDEETRDGLLRDIEHESERLSRMLENLLALARAELDREVVLEPVLLQRLLPRLVESITASTGREISFATEPDLPAAAAEPGYVEHIIRNLVGNAIKYSPPNSPIEVVAGSCGPGAAVRVLDRGFGIANDEAGKIFERFYRSDRTSRLAGGAGLGLAVCKRLVEAMSGEIWARPREGGGLEVGFSVPEYREEDVEG